ncbi:MULTISPECIES: hypothetical protein [unclassified Meridianimarinicoccus]|uniref:hypothetical protein n=1 Tax=unclassified Meridianimarinicoccus TaxID=2923344 RepID=UPI001868880C|nr:hypothetical protein [Fluviibacterium sp. MJW13]
MKRMRPAIALGLATGLGVAAVTAAAQSTTPAQTATSALSTGTNPINNSAVRNVNRNQPFRQFFLTGARPGFSRLSLGAPGRRQTASYNTNLEFNDNYDLREDSLGNALIWNNILGYGIERRTLTDEFTFDGAVNVRATDLPTFGNDVEADDWRFNLGYLRVVGDNSLDFDVRYQNVDVAFFNPLSDLDINGNFDDTFGEGRRESMRGNFGASLNQDGPVSFDLVGYLSRVNFYDTTDPSLNDRDRADIAADFGFALSPILKLTAGGFYGRRIEDDADDLDSTHRRLNFGMDGLVNQRMRLRAWVGYSEVDTKRNSGDKFQSGYVGGINVTVAQKNGDLRFGASTRYDENGLRLDTTVGKSLNWASGSLDGNIGVSGSDTTDLRLIGDLAYTYNLRNGQFWADFAQITGVDQNGDNVINSALDLGYRQAINRVSSFNVGVGGALQRYDNSGKTEKDRFNVTAAYNHALTRDWSLNTGYRYRLRDTESQNRAQSNAVFLGLGRNWQSDL